MRQGVAADLALGESLRKWGPPPHSPGPLKAAFVTGATGFLGRHLVRELLERPELEEIVCLVRAEGKTHARTRLVEALGDDTDRVKAVAGDISRPRFGLSEGAFERLAAGVDTVLHCAADTNLVYPYRHLRATNVQGTYESLRLAMMGRAKTYHFVSSLSVAASLWTASDGDVIETFRVPGVSNTAPGYAVSKWVAEELVHTAAEEGLPVCIIRPGVITGHSRCGACNPRDALSMILRACLRLGVAPISEEQIYFTPVDFVSQATAELVARPGTTGKAYHLVNGSYLTWGRASEIMFERGYVERATPYREWVACLRNVAGADTDLALLGAMLPDKPDCGDGHAPRFDDANTRDALAARPDVRCPDDNAAMLIRCLQWLNQNETRYDS